MYSSSTMTYFSAYIFSWTFSFKLKTLLKMCYQSNINVLSKGSLIRQDNLLFLKDAIFIALRVVCSK